MDVPKSRNEIRVSLLNSELNIFAKTLKKAKSHSQRSCVNSISFIILQLLLFLYSYVSS